LGSHATEKRACLALSCTPGIGPVLLRSLFDRFGSASAALAAPRDAWRAVAGPSIRLPDRAEFDWADAQLRKIYSHSGGDVYALGEPSYPPALREIHDPPPALFALGAVNWQRPAVALVGTRHPTPYGLQVARELAFGLARAGVCVLSGMALGIDAAAHQGALEGGGTTVAVLGSGVDQPYPRSHTGLYRRIIGQGAVVSELSMGSVPDRGSFPRRNRIISGLSRGVVVVEAAARSGALITARCAAEQGRDVFAVPGEIFRASSAGCHALLKDGATLVRSVDDILAELNPWSRVQAAALVPPAGVAGRVYALLGREPVHIDELAERDLSSAEVSAALLELELAGWVAQYAGQRFARRA
jgi:DNA processing protein